MENALGENVPIGVYRTCDDIKHLKVRVKIRKITNVGMSEDDIQESSELGLVNLAPISIEQIFQWQDDITKDKENPSAVHSKHSFLTLCLFTYTDDDLFTSKWKSKRCGTYPFSRLCHLEKKREMAKCTRSRLFGSRKETWQKPSFLQLKQIVKMNGCQGLTFPSGQCMVIMAALYFEDSSACEEMELCFLHLSEDDVLTVIPDFAQSASYTFLNSRSETFEYTLENVSGKIKSGDAEKKKALLRKIEFQQKKIAENLVGKEFLQPPVGVISYVVNCEIVSASKFQSENIFVHYFVHLPDEWTCTNTKYLEGVTQTCRCKYKDQVLTAYFGYPFSLDIEVQDESVNSGSLHAFKLIIEVISVDTWGNFRNEGYGCTDFALKPGVHKCSMDTWKLEPHTLNGMLRNLFIGGTPCLEDLSYVGNPKNKHATQLSKYGTWTVTSGTVILQYGVLAQHLK